MNNKVIKICLTLGSLMLVGCNTSQVDTSSMPKVSYFTHTHEYTQTFKDPTCESYGYTINQCECGDTQLTDYIDPLHHSFTNWKIEQIPSFEDMGVIKSKCDRCEDVADSTLPVLDDDRYIVDIIYEASCEENGLANFKIIINTTLIENATFTFDAVLPKKGHSYKNNIIEPTCTEVGYTEHYCECGDSYIDNYVDSKGHSFSEWKLVKEPTISNDGLLERICKIDSNHKENHELNSLNKVDYIFKVDYESTCYSKGQEKYTYEIDNQVFEFFNGIDLDTHELKNDICTKCGDCVNEIHIGYWATEGGMSVSGASVNEEDWKCSKIIIPEAKNGVPVVAINDNVFNTRYWMETIVLTKNITYIGENAFWNCENLKEVYYNGTIEDWCKITFASASSNPMSSADRIYFLNENDEYYEVTDLVLPNDLESINDYAFNGFKHLRSITLSNNLKNIGTDAFLNCYRLKEIYNLCNFDLVIGTETYGSIARYAKRISTSIVNSNIVIKDDFVFYNDENCYLFDYVGDSKNVVLPAYFNDKQYNIDEYAFFNNYFVDVFIPDTVLSIGYCSFLYSKMLVSLRLPYIGNTLSNENNLPFTYIFNSYGGVPNSLINVTIAGGIIVDEAFSHCATIQTLYLLESVTYIGEQAFRQCSSLTTLYIPNSMKEMKNSFGEGCHISNIYFNGTIEDWCSIRLYATDGMYTCSYPTPMRYNEKFYIKNDNNEYELISNIIKIPSIEIINQSQFESFDFESIILPNSVKLIEVAAFRNCSNLKNIYYEGTIEDYFNIILHYDTNASFLNATTYYYSEDIPTEEGLYWHYGEDGVTPIVW